jgi:hypothetical protein
MISGSYPKLILSYERMKNKKFDSLLNKRTKYFVFLGFVSILALAGILFGAIQHDLKYSELNDYYILNISSETQTAEDLDQVIKKVSKESNVAKIDRTKNNIYFQNTDITSVEGIAANLIKEPYTYNITSVLSSTSIVDQSILLGKIFLIFIASITALIGYFAFKTTNTNKSKSSIYFLAFTLLVLVITTLEGAGFGMLVSTVYMVKKVDLLTALVIPIFLMLFTTFFAGTYATEKVSKLNDVLVLVKKIARDNGASVIKLSVPFFLIPILGFGTNYVVFATLIVLMLVITTLNLYVFSSVILELMLRRTKSKTQNASSDNAKKQPNTKLEKKSKVNSKK